jgi:hypothetical protein
MPPFCGRAALILVACLICGSCGDGTSKLSSPCKPTGQTEVCDGKDNDCDGEVDEDAIDAVTWYADNDGDGFGHASTKTVSCTEPAGAHVQRTGDCDDAKPSVNPEAEEICDGLDNDCDDAVDNDAIDASIWFFDRDGDGFGDEGSPVVACEAPEQAIAAGGDCNDNDDDAFPGAVEPCGVGEDLDCDGLVATGCRFSGIIDLSDADRKLVAAESGLDRPHFGAPVNCGDDVTGDGLTDVGIQRTLFSSPSLRVAHTIGRGAVAALELGGLFVSCSQVFGGTCYYPVSELDQVEIPLDAYTRQLGAVAPLRTGLLLAEGDGEAIVGGGVSIFPVDWVGIDEGTVKARVRSADYAESLFGESFDVVEDERALLIGARHDSRAGPYAGAVYLMRGPFAGVHDVEEAAAVFVGVEEGDIAGTAVADAGDVNGDGAPDLLVGAPHANNEAGAAYLVYGPANGTQSLADVDVVFEGEASGDTAGWSLAGAGDLDGDGFDDLLIGAYAHGSGETAFRERGAVYLFYGPVQRGVVSLGDADAVFVGEAGFDWAGYALAMCRDINGDGRADFVVGAHMNDEAGPEAGAAYVVFGR